MRHRSGVSCRSAARQGSTLSRTRVGKATTAAVTKGFVVPQRDFYCIPVARILTKMPAKGTMRAEDAKGTGENTNSTTSKEASMIHAIPPKSCTQCNHLPASVTGRSSQGSPQEPGPVKNFLPFGKIPRKHVVSTNSRCSDSRSGPRWGGSKTPQLPAAPRKSLRASRARMRTGPGSRGRALRRRRARAPF